MASSLRFVKSITNNNTTLLQLLTYYIFNGKEPKAYDTTKTYAVGDVILTKAADGTLAFYGCNTAGTTGTYDSTKWDTLNVADAIKMSSALDTVRDHTITDMVSLLVKMSSLVPKPFQLNHVYADNFDVSTRITLSKGVAVPGKIFV